MLCRFVSSALPSTVRRSSPVANVVGAAFPQRQQLANPAFPARAFSEAPSSPAPQQPQQQQRFPAPAPQPMGDRVYTDFHIYKTRGAFALKLLPPTFAERVDGSKYLDRDGCLMLEFANPNPQQQGAPQGSPGAMHRTYNWGNKINFALTPVELGNILAGEGLDKEKGLTFYHDPAKLGKNGEPMKRLTLKSMPDGAISFSMYAGPDSVSVPVSRGEFEVFKSIAQFAIPRLMGFGALFPC